MNEAGRKLGHVARSVADLGMEATELYVKEGRSRRASLGAHGRVSSLHHESGWAVRATGSQSSLFCCGSGQLDPTGPWPGPDGFPIRLPSGQPPVDWQEPVDLQSPLLVEHEAFELLEACDRELTREVAGARLVMAALEDGESDAEIASSLGVEVELRSRSATLYLEAALGSFSVSEFRGARRARDFAPSALARRLTDRLLIRKDGAPGDRDRASVVLAPPVATRILGALLPILLGSRNGELPEWVRSGRLGSDALGIVDDGRLPEGVLSAPTDGEGVRTGRIVLVERGRFRSGLLPWWERSAGESRLGCVRRESYRDIPRVGPSHLFIEPDPSRSAASLLEGLSRGYYLLEVQDAGRFDLAEDYFEIRVAGFVVRDGKPTGSVSGALLSGSLSRLLGGIQAAARDLTFFSFGGLLGAPSLLVAAAELNRPARA